ncbi:hypothetical protein DFH06DRAFT_1152567 [Mycena polygramma]|nr:hypothetical protein DFH06DRAFT_1152567 [Mycena polygramma]
MLRVFFGISGECRKRFARDNKNERPAPFATCNPCQSLPSLQMALDNSNGLKPVPTRSKPLRQWLGTGCNHIQAAKPGKSVPTDLGFFRHSNAFGDLMQPDDDDEAGILDDLHRENIRAQKGTTNAFFSKPPRFRKISMARNIAGTREEDKPRPKAKPIFKSAKGALSLADFAENQPFPSQPEPKTKTQKKNPAKKTRPNAEPKPNTVSSSYGTRSKSKKK